MVRFRLCAALLAVAASTQFAMAQQQPGLPLPRLDSITPMGAKVGTTVAEVTLQGTDLDEADALVFSHPGIKAEVVKPEPPKVDPKDPKKAPPPPPKAPLPPNKFKITVAADVPVGQYDVRAVNKFGVSNPRVFAVGDLPEVMEKEPNNDVPEAMKIELNTTVNGTIASPTDVDLYLVAAKKGQRVVCACIAESIDSKARPLVEVYDPSGRRLATQNGPDAIADFIAPADASYFVRIAEFTYTTGGANHFYRLTITTNPWIDAVFPPMVEAGKAAQVSIYGRNLPGGVPEPGASIDGRPLEKLVVSVTAPATSEKLLYHGRVEPRSGAVDGFEYRIKGPGGSSNAAFIAFAQGPVVLEKEPNDKPAEPMELPGICEVAGRIDKRNDRDWYALPVKKGENFSIDLWADRLGVANDFSLSLRLPKATTDAVEKDDNPETLSNTQFYTRTTDPDPILFTAVEDGKYFIQVTSKEAGYQYGPRVPYRLKITRRVPDFRLVAMPASNFAPDVTVLRADGNNYLEIYAFRQDDFLGPIALTVEGLPAGVTCAPQVIAPGQKSAGLVLSAATTAANFTGPITIKGTATIAGKPVVHEARAATISWAMQPGQNLPASTRLDASMMLAVRDKAMFKVTAEPENAVIKMGDKPRQPMFITQGEKLTVPFKIVRTSPDAKVPITLQQVSTTQNPQQMPLTVNNGQPVAAIAADKTDGTFVIDAKTTAVPGLYTIVMKATAQIQYEREGTKGKKPATVEQSATPITIRVVPVSLGKVTAAPVGNLKGGLTSDVVVKVTRENGYEGEYKVKLVLPMGTKGITAADATIPAGQSEVKVTLTAAADAMAGPVQNIVAQVTGMHEGNLAITQEAKFNVTVEKAPAKKEEPKKK